MGFKGSKGFLVIHRSRNVANQVLGLHNGQHMKPRAWQKGYTGREVENKSETCDTPAQARNTPSFEVQNHLSAA